MICDFRIFEILCDWILISNNFFLEDFDLKSHFQAFFPTVFAHAQV